MNGVYQLTVSSNKTQKRSEHLQQRTHVVPAQQTVSISRHASTGDTVMADTTDSQPSSLQCSLWDCSKMLAAWSGLVKLISDLTAALSFLLPPVRVLPLLQCIITCLSTTFASNLDVSFINRHESLVGHKGRQRFPVPAHTAGQWTGCMSEYQKPTHSPSLLLTDNWVGSSSTSAHTTRMISGSSVSPFEWVGSGHRDGGRE